MNWHTAKRSLQLFLLSVTACISSLPQDAQPHPTGSVQSLANADSDVGLILSSAERVYLSSRIGETIDTNALPGHASGRVPPNADKALAGLSAAISEWHRFTIVDTSANADLVLTIIEGNRKSGLKTGALTEKLQVTRGGSKIADAPILWESPSHTGGIADYRPVAKTVKELRSVIEDYEKKIPQGKIAQARQARKTDEASGGCAAEEKDELDCLSHSSSELFLPEDREENRGAVKLTEAVLNVSPLDMPNRIATQDFSNYVVAMQKLLHKQFTAEQQQTGWDLAVMGTLQADGKAKIELRTRPSADSKQLQTFYDNLQAVSSPAVKGDPLEFQVIFAVWGGSEESKAGH